MSFISYDSENLTPLKENNPEYQPSYEEVLSYAQEILNLALPADMDLIYLAEEALKAPLPKDWEACEYFVNSSEKMEENIIEDESIIVYRNKKTKEVIYDHPFDIVYKEKARQLKLMKNTAKYSENVTPINEELMESSVIILNKNNSKNSENEENKSEIKIRESSLSDNKSKDNRNFSYKNSELAKNVTEESVLEEESNDEFENLSMITDYEELIAENKEVVEHNKNSLKLLKEKPNVVRPIYVPTEKERREKKLKEKLIKLETEKQIKNKIKEMIFSTLLHINTTKMNEFKENLKSSHNMKQIQQKISIMREFDKESSPEEIKKLYKKEEELKRLERENKLMDEKIKETIKLIELEKNFLSNPLLFHDSA